MTDSLTPSEAVDLYLADRKPEVADSTYRNHKYHLNEFLDWCDHTGVTDMSEMDGRTIFAFKKHQRDKTDINKMTLRNHLNTFRVFLRFCESLDAVEDGLVEKVRIPDFDVDDATRDLAIRPERAEAILDYLQKFEYASLRHALFYLIWHTGLRTGTVHSLDIEDFNPHEQYLDIRHRPDEGTSLKNKTEAEREVHLKQNLVDVLADYVDINRHDVVDDHDRRPLFTSKSGRLYPSMIQRYIYTATRPCHYGEDCPEGRDPEDCDAAYFSNAYECPVNISPHPLRRSAITAHLSEDIPKEIVSDRADVSTDVLDKHYDARTASEKRKQRRDHLKGI